MDVDLAQVRAFVATVEHRHFGRAARQLFITQQSLSKRIRRLEQTLDRRLLIRDHRGVELTDAGRRFLPHARRLLSGSDAAVAAVQQRLEPLRVDIWGHAQAPARIVRWLVAETPELPIEASMRRSVSTAIQALQRHEIDAAFGRVHDLDQPLPASLAHQPVVLAPAAAAVGPEHPLAGAVVLHPADLRPYALWLAATGPPEVVGWFRRFADDFDIPLDSSGHHLGIGDVIDALRRERVRVGLLSAEELAPAGIRLIQLDPVPVYPWSLVWRRDDPHPLLARLRETIARIGKDEAWLDYDAEREWLPDVDRPGVMRVASR